MTYNIAQKRVMSEAEEHNDLVVEDFQESYFNLLLYPSIFLEKNMTPILKKMTPNFF